MVKDVLLKLTVPVGMSDEDVKMMVEHAIAERRDVLDEKSSDPYESQHYDDDDLVSMVGEIYNLTYTTVEVVR